MSGAPPEPFQQGFARLLGIELVEYEEGEVRVRFAVRDELRQPLGLLDGGVYAGVAEDVCSMATWAAVSRGGHTAMGMVNQTSLLRPVTDGHVHAVARARHRGRTTWVWDVDFTDDGDRLCAITRMTVAVRPVPS